MTVASWQLPSDGKLEMECLQHQGLCKAIRYLTHASRRIRGTLILRKARQYGRLRSRTAKHSSVASKRSTPLAPAARGCPTTHS